MNIKRLEMLKEAIQQAIDAECAFDMGDWAVALGEGKYEMVLGSSVDIEKANMCGTACCIAGWGGAHPGLQAEGLSLVVGGYQTVDLTLYGQAVHITKKESSILNRETGCVEVVDQSLSTFFGISYIQAEALFCYDLDQHLSFLSTARMKEAWEYRGEVRRASLPNAILVIDKILSEKGVSNESLA